MAYQPDDDYDSPPPDVGGVQQLARQLGAARMPPHSLEAEQAVLGGLLVATSDGFDRVSDVVTEHDFYEYHHRLIFRAISTIVTGNGNCDVVTVVSWLDQHGLLEDAQGLAYVGALPEVTPSAANIKAYASIVRERSVMRQLIKVATEIADSAFDSEGRSSKDLLDEAETKVFAIADQTASNAGGFQDIKSILAGAIERINTLFESDASITGIATGFDDLDEMTSGLQRSDLIIIAGRPSMGKTTFAMNIAEHVALTAESPVAVFSMEMPAEQLGMRLISSLGRVELQKLRTGRLAEQDWPRIASAITLLNQKRSVYIDDTPAMSPTDLRARARRLAREHGLSLIVIDYLQLMQISGGKENRATEISEISRSLKALAKELDVPIIALSQLNRSLEQRPDKRPVMSDLRECVTGDTRVALSDGRQVEIESLVSQSPEIVSITPRGKREAAIADRVWPVGEREVLSVSLASGRTVRCTAEHRLLAFDGWRTAGSLGTGDRVALARSLPEPTASSAEDPMSEPETVLLAHLVGDGSCVEGQPPRCATASEYNSRIVRSSAESLGSTVTRHSGKGNRHRLAIAGNGNRWHPAGVGKWLEAPAVFGERSRWERLPDPVFQLSDERLALFLRHLWATDGSITARGRGRIRFATASRRLAEDVAALLSRFDIVGRLRCAVSRGSTWHTVDVSGREDMLGYLERIGAVGEQAERVERLHERLMSTRGNTMAAAPPEPLFEEVGQRVKARGMSHRGMAAARGASCGGTSHFSFSPSRSVLESHAEILDDDASRRHASSDLFWDRVISVEPSGTEPVFDLTVPGNESWVANGIVSHNSGAIEQDADVIMFIYRDEVYNPEEEASKGKAEILIRKQRNGPIGSCTLTFLGMYTRFENYSPEIMGGEFS